MQKVTIRDMKSIVKKTHKLLIDTGHSLPVMIHGPAGVGKSDSVRQVAKDLGIKCIDIRLSLLNPVDLRGLPSIVREKGKDAVATWVSSGFLPIAERDGEEGILFLDEINLAPMTVMNAGYQLILDRALGEYKLPAKWSIVAAGNRTEDTGNITKMPPPLANRFIHYEMERPDAEEWRSWAVQNGISDRVIAFLHKFPQHLFVPPKNAEKTFPSPRSWSFASDLFMINEPVDAAVGAGVASDFKAYCEVYTRVPDIQKILRGEKERVPDKKELDVLWATSMAIVVAAKPEHWENVFKYIDEFSAEFGTMVIKLLSDKSPEWFNKISHSTEFKEFRTAHPALFEKEKDDE